MYVVDDRHAQTKGHAHLTLLAETTTGYANLIKLCSLGYLEGYYYRPRVDWELLERHAPGLIALSGCLSGRVSRRSPRARIGDAEMELDRLEQIFGRDNTYVELQNAGLEIQQSVVPRAARARRRKRACRSSRPATSTTSTPPTRTRTRRSSASSRATR